MPTGVVSFVDSPFFIGSNSAFDSVKWNDSRRIMLEHSFTAKLIRMMRATFDGFKSSVWNIWLFRDVWWIQAVLQAVRHVIQHCSGICYMENWCTKKWCNHYEVSHAFRFCGRHIRRCSTRFSVHFFFLVLSLRVSFNVRRIFTDSNKLGFENWAAFSSMRG